MGAEAITVVETVPIESIKYCIVGVPDVGLVGLIAVSHIIHSLEMPEVGHLESDILPPIVVIHKGDPKSPFRFFSKGKLVIITSEVPFSAATLPILTRSIVDWAKSKGVELLISVSGTAVQNRLDIETPAVYGIGASSVEKQLLSKVDIEPLEEGFIVGPHALILRECLKKNVPNVVLLAQSHYQYPDPGAAASIVTALNKLLNLNVDVKKLLEQAEEIRLKTRELMQRTQRSMQGMQKAQEQEFPAMYV
jgi:uncharacterized protein